MYIDNMSISPSNDEQDYNNINVSFTIGLILTLSSSLIIGLGFIIKKKSASAGKEWMYWIGTITMGIGEGAYLVAYAFTPAALVTFLAGLRVLVDAILSSKFLQQKLNFIEKIGCFLCIMGSIIFVLHSPKSEEIKTFSELIVKMKDYVFIVYVATILFVSFITDKILVPKFGNRNILVYLFMCSAIGSLTVVFCKAVALGIKETFANDVNNFANNFFWILFVTSGVCIMKQMNYLNKSLLIFNTSVVTPVYYVMFTLLVIIASGILFREWEHMKGTDILGCISGYILVIIAVFMLTVFKDVQISFKDLKINAGIRRSIPNITNLNGQLNAGSNMLNESRKHHQVTICLHYRYTTLSGLPKQPEDPEIQK